MLVCKKPSVRIRLIKRIFLENNLDRDERDRAMLVDQAIRKFHDQINGTIGKSLTKKQLVESMVISRLKRNYLTMFFSFY